MVLHKKWNGGRVIGLITILNLKFNQILDIFLKNIKIFFFSSNYFPHQKKKKKYFFNKYIQKNQKKFLKGCLFIYYNRF
jgi:hypothetical protein